MSTSVIYFIVFKNNPNKIYIGSAVNFGKRKQRHLRELRKGHHFNYKLQNYFNKYGSGCFGFYVIQHVLPDSLVRVEQFFIDSLQPFFNINPVAGSRLGSKHSVKTKLLISEKARLRGRTYVLRYKKNKIVILGK